MSTHNIGFYEDLTKIIFELSSNIIKYAPYFFCCFLQLSSWVTGGGTLPVNSNVWDELLRTSNQFLKNIADLQNIDIDGLIAYGESLLKYLGELATPTTSTSSYTAQCESTLQQFYGTEFYDTTILPVLNSVYTQTYLQYEYQVLAEGRLKNR